MKNVALAAAAALGLIAIAAPAQAALFNWDIEYTGYFSEDATISGTITADSDAATDGFLSTEELSSWVWNWSGNSEVDAFSISSDSGEIQSFFGPAGFFVDGTANVPGDDASEGVYADGAAVIDFDFLLVSNASTPVFGEAATMGDLSAPGTVTVSAAQAVPEPATVFGLLALAATAVTVKRQKQTA